MKTIYLNKAEALFKLVLQATKFYQILLINKQLFYFVDEREFFGYECIRHKLTSFAFCFFKVFGQT